MGINQPRAGLFATIVYKLVVCLFAFSFPLPTTVSQFTVTCTDTNTPATFSAIGGGTSDEQGFLLNFGPETGIVLGFSLSGAVIPASESCKQPWFFFPFD